MSNKTNNIWRNGIMGVVVGDALGMPVQFLTREDVKDSPVTGMEGYGTYNMPEGTWSDDSSMTLATLCSLIDSRKVDYEDIMERFVAWDYKGEYTPFGTAFDQGRTCTAAIYNYVKNKNINTCGLDDEYSNGNGSLMRIMPICLWAYEENKKGNITEDEALHMVHQVSALTHAHLRSKMGCGFYYFMVKAILDMDGTLIERLQKGVDDAVAFYHKGIENLVQMAHYGRLFHLSEFKAVDEDEIKSSGYVVDSLEAAVWSLITTKSFKEAGLKAVNLGGDTDTIGAIACGLAGLYYGFDAIPTDWLVTIKKREKIEDLCGRLDIMEVKLVDDVRITDDNVNEIEIEYVVAVAYASDGAMGEPGAVRLYIIKDWEMKCYYINRCNSFANIVCLFVKYPELDECIRKTGKLKGFEYIGMGMGNHLLIRSELYNDFERIHKQNGKHIYQSYVSTLQQICTEIKHEHEYLVPALKKSVL